MAKKENKNVTVRVASKKTKKAYVKKSFPLKDVLDAMKELKSNPPPVVNKNLEKRLKKVARELLAKETRKEALEILIKSGKERIGEFFYYYYSNVGNVACMVLDSAKDDLVKAGKMKQLKTDNFGGVPYGRK